MTSNSNPAGFWSYTHRDDEIEEGRIRRLAKKIANEFEGITAEELLVFIDKDDVKWGDEWRNRIDSALTGATFFMPIVTPRFFRSEECRREILTFSGHARSLGLEELLLPILYFDVPQVRQGNAGGDVEDEVIALVAKRHFKDWTSLRLQDENSPEYRQAVHELAVQIVEILERTASIEPPPVTLTEGREADEEPGMLELMAAAEDAIPRWAKVMEEFSKTMEEIGRIATEATAEMENSDSRGGGFAGRLRVTEKLARNLQDPVDKMSALGNRYSAELVTIDPGILGIIRQVESEGIDPQEREQVEYFFETIGQAVREGRAAMPGIQAFHDSLEVLSSISKSTRPLAGKMRTALQQVLDGQAILDEWERRADEVLV